MSTYNASLWSDSEEEVLEPQIAAADVLNVVEGGLGANNADDKPIGVDAESIEDASSAAAVAPLFELSSLAAAGAATDDQQCVARRGSGSRCAPIVVKAGPLVPAIREGYALPTNLATAIQTAVKAEGAAVPDPLLEKIAKDHLSPEYHLASWSVMEKNYNLEPKAIQQRLDRLAAALIQVQNSERRLFESQVVGTCSKHQLVYHMELNSYDETPLYISLRSDGIDESSKSAMAEAPAAAAQVLVDVKSLAKTQSQIGKILQVQSGYVMLLTGASHTLALVGTQQNPLQVMSSTSAAVLKHCLLRLGGASPAVERFMLRARSVVTDQAKSNIRCEQELAAMRKLDCHMHLFCDLHVLATSHKKTFDGLVAGDITGLIWTSLSFRTGSSLAVLRAAIKSVIKSRLKLVVGTLSPAALDYKRMVVDLFIRHMSSPLVKSVLLLRTLTGDWRDGESIVYCVSPGCDMPSLATAQCLVEHCLLTCFAACKPTVWPRHRWRGAEKAVGHIALMAAVHNLLQPIYQTYLQILSCPGDVAAAVERLNKEMEDLVAGELRCGSALGVVEEEVAPPMADDERPEDPFLSNVKEFNMANHAQENAKCRQLAWSWVSSAATWPHLLLISILLQPFTELFNQQFELNGEHWEAVQRAKMIVAMSEGDMSYSSRDYPLVLAAEGALEKRFFDSMHSLVFQSSVWNHFPDQVHACSFRALAFKLFSRAGAATYQLYSFPHQLFPYRTFLLISHPELAEEISAIPDCCKDGWTLALQREHGFVGLPENVLSILVLTAMTQHTDIGHVEANHASIRRHVMQKSVQTWTLTLLSASTQWVFQRLRRAAASGKPKAKIHKASFSAQKGKV
eukprot:2934459-Amphidinium_carterae.7